MEMRPGEMDGVKKESASETFTPPGSGPCRLALPGLYPYMECAGRRIIIPEGVYDEAYWDIRGEVPNQKRVFVIHLKKEEPISCG